MKYIIKLYETHSSYDHRDKVPYKTHNTKIYKNPCGKQNFSLLEINNIIDKQLKPLLGDKKGFNAGFYHELTWLSKIEIINCLNSNIVKTYDN